MSNHNMASRKRRSSILKSKPRLPLTEVEFNPPTPTDTAGKSRRVSFSRRTSVAEFVVNEATTTWRNIYEQNRTLDSSGNDSELQRATTVNNKSLHQQFTDLEAEIDCTTLGNIAHAPGTNVTMFNDMNFTEQLASLECITGDPLKLPSQNFDVSVMGEKSRVFSDGFANSIFVEQSGRIEVDFSMIQQVRQTELQTDDLSDIAKDLEKSNPTIGTSFLNEFNNRSHYVDVDLNVTKVFHDISDMSITDTIQRPTSPALAQSVARGEDKKKPNFDRIADKENIIMESFPKPLEDPLPRSDENVLVFDGKKLKVANLHDKIDDIVNETPGNVVLNSQPFLFDRQKDIKIITEINNSLSIKIAKQHKLYNTMVAGQVNLMTDMSSIYEDNNKENIIKPTVSLRGSVVPSFSQKGRVQQGSSLYEDSGNNGKGMIGNISKLPSDKVSKLEQNADIAKDDLRADKDIVLIEPGVYDNASCITLHSERDKPNYISKILPSHRQPIEFPHRKTIVLNHDDDLPNFTLDVPPQFDQSAVDGLRKSIVFDTEDSVSNLPIPAPELDTKLSKRRTFKAPVPEVEQENTVVGNKNDYLGILPMSMIHVIPPDQKSQTIFFNKNNNEADMSMTQAIAQGSEKRRTIIFNRLDNIGDMSMTQAIPAYDHAVLEKHRTIVFDKHDDLGDMSITQAIPQMARTEGTILNYEEHLIKSSSQDIKNKSETIFFNKNDNEADMSMTQGISQCSEKRRTIIFDKHDNIGDMSMTRAIGAYDAAVLEQLRTTVFDKYDNLADMSITQAIPQKARADISMTQAIPAYDRAVLEKCTTILFDKHHDLADMSITQAVSQNARAEYMIPNKEHLNKSLSQDIKNKSQTAFSNKNDNEAKMPKTQGIPQCTEKRRTFIFDRHNNIGDMSMTQAVPMLDPAVLEKLRTDKHNVLPDMPITRAIPQKSRTEGTISNDKEYLNKPSSQDIKNKSQTIVFNKNDNEADMSMTQGIPQCTEKRRTFIFDRHDNIGDMSMTQAIPMLDHAVLEKLRTDKHNVLADMPITRAIPHKSRTEGMISKDKEHLNKPSSQDIKNKSQTIVFNKNDNENDMSMTQGIPQCTEKRRTIIFDRHDNIGDMSMTQEIPAYDAAVLEKRRTIVFDKHDDLANMSITQAISQKAGADGTTPYYKEDLNKSPSQYIKNKSQTIISNKNYNGADMSMTQAYGMHNRTAQEQRTTNVLDKKNVLADMSITQAIPEKARAEGTIPNDKEDLNKSSSQDIYSHFLNNSRNNGRLAIKFHDEIKPGPGARKMAKSKKITFNDTNDLLNLLTEYTEPSTNIMKENLLVDKIELHGDESQVTLRGDDVNMSTNEDAGQASEVCTKSRSPEKALVTYIEEDKSVGKICVAHNTTCNLSLEPINHVSIHRPNNSMVAHSTKGTENRKTTNCSTVYLMEMSSNSTENKEIGNTSDGKKSGFTYQNMRKSIILSREEILNNISMAQKLLEQSSFNMDETDTTMDEESVQDLSTEQEPHTTTSKSIRLSKDVVKTLKFDDDDSLCRQRKGQNNLPFSVVRKSNYNDDFNPKMNTKIPKVITQGLNDQEMDNIKDLMAHLVKPTADLPLYSDSQPSKERSVDLANASLQCNIETPSQIDIEDEQLQTEMRQPSVEVQADLKCNDAAEVGKKSRVSFNPNYMPFRSSGEFNMDRIVDSTLAQIANRQQHSIREENETYSSSGTSQRPLEKDHSGSGKPIIFDQNNPLNNIVLASFSCDNNSPVARKLPQRLIHSPRKETKSVGEIKFDAHNPLNNVCLNVDNVSKMSTPGELGTKSSDTSVARLKESIMMDALQENAFYIASSNITTPIIKETKKLKNCEVNTLIAMKQNEELLENTSAITLVDETLEGSAMHADLDADAEPQSHTTIATDKTSMTYTTDPNAAFTNLDVLYMVGTDVFSEGETTEGESNTKVRKSGSRSPDKLNKDKIKGYTAHNSRKRNLSPTNYGKHRNCTLGTLEVTPKPQEKMQKASTSPFITQSDHAKLRNIVRGVTKVNSPEKIKPSAVGRRGSVSPDKNKTNSPNRFSPKKSGSSSKFGSAKSHDRKSPSKTCRKAIRLPSPPANRDNAIDKVDSEVLTSKSNVISSSNYNTGNNHADHHPTDAIRISRVLKDEDAMLDDESGCDGSDIIGTSSGSEVSLDDSLQEIMDVPKSNDIITMINQLPFMGTWCCEWECAAADEWSFLLMHKRVRLRVKLAHCSENGLGAGVIPHTPVESVLVDSLLGETEHAVALLSVRACVEALRAESATAGCDSAESVVALLPRCAGISRAAMQWGRAMQTARMHLAYALAPDGQVRLKVANVPLRSVWEVTLRVCLGAHPGSPGDEWPRAVDVRAALLEPDAAPEELAELLEAVPRGWGHVPNTIWKVFKYFKHKTKEDDWMQALMR